MKLFRLILLFSISFFLLAACSTEPVMLTTSAPTASALAAVSPSPSPSASQALAVLPLYSGEYGINVLPASIPDLSEADRKVFNPGKVRDYLATCEFADHDYFIKGAELKGETLYLTIKDDMYFYVPSQAYDYLKERFVLSDETILALPEFSGCYIAGGLLNTYDDVLRFKSRILAPVPVPEDVSICPNASEISLAEFKEFVLNGKSKNDELAIHTEFDCRDGQLIIYYCDAGKYGVPIDREHMTIAVHDPASYEFGSLPKSLLGINDTQAETFDPDKVTGYLLASPINFEHYYSITDMQVSDGNLSLIIADGIDVDADDAYQYLKEQFSLSDDMIMQLPLFSGCSIHEGEMYTQEQLDYINGIEPEWCEEYNLNSIGLGEIQLPKPVPVADDADIILVDYDDTLEGYHLTVPQFIEYMQYMKADNQDSSLWGVWFKYSNGEITAMIEAYAP